MFYDLNVPWSANDAQLPRTLAFLIELGYGVVALNHSISGKLPADLSCAVPNPLPSKDVDSKLEIRRRVTLTLTQPHQNARLAELGKAYDILALRPVDERTLQLACSSLDCEIISVDLTQRLPFFFKFKMLNEAIRSGKRFEICYAQALLGDRDARRNLISNATALIRASRGRGLIISSEARAAVGCRGPWDAINLATIWGLGQERGFEAMSKDCRSVVVGAQLKRTSYRGVVDVVYGGEKPGAAEIEALKATANQVAGNAQKRKADAMEDHQAHSAANPQAEKPLSKTQQKKRAKREKEEAAKMAVAAKPASNPAAIQELPTADIVDVATLTQEPATGL